MREILFKAKRIDNGEWVEGRLIYNLSPFHTDNTIRDAWIKERLGNISETYEVDPETVCQYTGLKDKNGVKVFEDDEIKCPAEVWHSSLIAIDRFNGVKATYEGYVETVEFDYELLSTRENDYPEHWEVIGNIHDKE